MRDGNGGAGEGAKEQGNDSRRDYVRQQPGGGVGGSGWCKNRGTCCEFKQKDTSEVTGLEVRKCPA